MGCTVNKNHIIVLATQFLQLTYAKEALWIIVEPTVFFFYNVGLQPFGLSLTCRSTFVATLQDEGHRVNTVADDISCIL